MGNNNKNNNKKGNHKYTAVGNPKGLDS